jgi:para-aminobenzoate synthetase/4-amino-4-deoxychorismate lyase
MIDAAAPFVLLDNARAGAGAPALLYQRPVEILETSAPDEVRPVLATLREAQRRGLHAAGFIAYEAGHALEPRLARLARATAPGEPPLLWFGLFETVEEVARVDRLLPDPASAWASAPEPLIERSDYEAAVARVKEHILAGDVYQANLTFQATVRTAGNMLALYAGLRSRGGAGHCGIVHSGAHWLLSFSPELFFSLRGRTLTARPMKGTAERRRDPAADAAAAASLPEDPKQRAENLMIVDLLRNDLSRVSRPGTVKVPSLFAVETYPTVHQMVSTVTAELAEGLDAVDVIGAIFPCGSITGAPKIRAMELIAEVEAGPRGVYTGAVGSVSPDGGASFNVAIRTLAMRGGEGRLGLGSGIVADSQAGEEWRECLAKGAFVAAAGGFDLIETMRFDARDGILELERHLQRLKASADTFGFPFNRHDVRNELQAATFRLAGERKLRLLLSKSGATAIESRPLPAPPAEPVPVAVVPLPVAPDDFRLRHKISARAFYEEARLASGAFEVLFCDPAGFLTEGSFTSLFVERGGRLLTPPLARGLLPGILRERLIAEGRAAEADLTAADLSDGFYLGNSVRGLIRAGVRV